MTYTAPVRDIQFVLNHICHIQELESTGAFEDVSDDLIEAVLWENAKFASEVLAPINQAGDQNPAHLVDGNVVMPPGFTEAYQQFVESGWNSLIFDPDFGGQGMPNLLGLACSEMYYAANLGFANCPMLTSGAVDAIQAHGTDEQKAFYLPKLISGEWTGTMNITEPHAGSDVGALRSKAVPQEDGSYRITGTKIFITYGDHEMTDNIIHLVLARIPGAPDGTKGLTLFIVPKYLTNEDGSLGARNDVVTAGLEHKMGIHGNPTCTLSFGEKDGAIGYVLGGENNGMACMFTMMNSARLHVGLQGVSLGNRSFQQALAFAQERKQGKAIGSNEEMSLIMEHPDVRRMLLTMKAQTEAVRAICYANAMASDLAEHHPDDNVRTKAKLREELLTPISKAFSTDVGLDVTSTGVQVHGGMGYIEETGSAQHYRDLRIAAIYEGTNGIQAMDLAVRKLKIAGGQAVKDFLADVGETITALKDSDDADLATLADILSKASDAVAETALWMGEQLTSDIKNNLAGATAYLKIFGLLAGGYYLGIGALAARAQIDAGQGDKNFYEAKITTALYYTQHYVSQVPALAPTARLGADALYALSPDQYAG